MSEKVGQSSTNQWYRFEQSLLKYAETKDWEKVRKVNELMMMALRTHGRARTAAQLHARQSLAKTHSKIIEQATAEKEAIAKEMKQFQSQRDGLAAYELTHVSGKQYDK